MKGILSNLGALEWHRLRAGRRLSGGENVTAFCLPTRAGPARELFIFALVRMERRYWHSMGGMSRRSGRGAEMAAARDKEASEKLVNILTFSAPSAAVAPSPVVWCSYHQLGERRQTKQQQVRTWNNGPFIWPLKCFLLRRVSVLRAPSACFAGLAAAAAATAASVR